MVARRSLPCPCPPSQTWVLLRAAAAVLLLAATPVLSKKPEQRCEWVVAQIKQHDANKTDATLCEQYHKQSADANMFYRGVDFIYWQDFNGGGWGNMSLADFGKVKKSFTRTSVWTWITGDQHLSNFGAWKNRNDEVQFGMNDFDEAVIFDFHLDIYRIATSIYDHAVTNGFDEDDAADAVESFAKTYIETLDGYVGNEDALLFTLTSDNAKGEVKDFLEKVEEEDTKEEQLRKFTHVLPNGTRAFVFNNDTRLLPMDAATRELILDQWTAKGYGSTLEKVGWHVQAFDPQFFHIIDFAFRYGSGDGSYGVPRYYLLINGTDQYANASMNNVILDVKYLPPAAARATLGEQDLDWYDHLFENEGARVNEAQRRLTCYTDPWLGWIQLGPNRDTYLVKERSAWKDDMKIEKLDDLDDFVEYVEQVGIVTATSHARGSVGDAPAQFKKVVTDILDSSKKVDAWAEAIAQVATNYRQQVLDDYACFLSYVKDKYPWPQCQ